MTQYVILSDMHHLPPDETILRLIREKKNMPLLSYGDLISGEIHADDTRRNGDTPVSHLGRDDRPMLSTEAHELS